MMLIGLHLLRVVLFSVRQSTLRHLNKFITMHREMEKYYLPSLLYLTAVLVSFVDCLALSVLAVVSPVAPFGVSAWTTKSIEKG